MNRKRVGAVLAVAAGVWLAWEYILKPKGQGSAAGDTSGVYVPGGSDDASQLVGTTIPLNPNGSTGLTDALGSASSIPRPTPIGGGSFGGKGDGSSSGVVAGDGVFGSGGHKPIIVGGRENQ